MAKEYIERNELIENLQKFAPEHYNALINQLITKQPTADVVEVVRCSKCKHGDVSILSKTKDGEECVGCYCTLKKVVTNMDSYCPSGRRRGAE